MKYCKDCRHSFKIDGYIEYQYWCKKGTEIIKKEDMIQGITYEKILSTCFIFRTDDNPNYCGVFAKYWEPSIWYRIRKWWCKNGR